MVDDNLYPPLNTANFNDRFSGLPVEQPQFDLEPNIVRKRIEITPASFKEEIDPKKAAIELPAGDKTVTLTPVSHDPFGGTMQMSDLQDLPRPIKTMFGVGGEERYQFWPERMVRSALSLPGDVITGRTPTIDPDTGHVSNELIERAQDMAGLAGTGGFGIQRNAAGVFGGRLSKTANLEKLAEAQEMAVKGIQPAAIWDATGWFRGADNKWKYEIPDQAAKLSPEGIQGLRAGQEQVAPAFIQHDALFEAYPELRDLKISKEVPAGSEGVSRGGRIGLNENLNPLSMKNYALHEIQHEIQNIEGFAKGGSPIALKPTVLDALRDHNLALSDAIAVKAMIGRGIAEADALARVKQQRGNDYQNTTEQLVKADLPTLLELHKEVGRTLADPLGYKEYRQLAGEVEARNVQVRALEEGKGFPLEQQARDVPLESQIVRGVNSKIAQNAGMVPVDIAKKLNVKTAEPNETLKAVVKNTPGASIDGDGALIVNVSRRQKPEQEMSDSVRGGVFYLPQGNKSFNYTGARSPYGGSQKLEGQTAYLNPLVVKGATGGRAPEMAYDQLLGKGSYQKMADEATSIATSRPYNRPDHNVQLELTQRFLEKYAPDMKNHADYILENSTKGNQLRYALQEAAVANEARKAGHDGIVGYSVKRNGDPVLSEVFDVRESHYPGTQGEYRIHDQFLKSDSGEVGKVVAAMKEPFYSAVENAVSKASNKMLPNEWLGPKTERIYTDKNTGKEITETKYGGVIGNSPGIKPEEIEWMGLPEWLNEKANRPGANRVEPVTKQEIQDFINENKMKLGEVIKDDIGGAKYLNANDINTNKPKYSKYQLPGAENYREMLLTLPDSTNPNAQISIQHKMRMLEKARRERTIESAPFNEQMAALDAQLEDLMKQPNYRSSHWDEPNVLAHIRMNDRYFPNPNNKSNVHPGQDKSLHIEEVQSDWHQQGREKGYQDPEKIAKDNARIEEINQELKDGIVGHSDRQRARALASERAQLESANMEAVPNAPFKKTWTDLAIKRIIREAAEKGYDRISWTPGEAQVARYDLSKQIDKLEYNKTTNQLTAMKGNQQVINETVPTNKLSDFVGKEAAEKLINEPTKKHHSIDNENLRPDEEAIAKYKGEWDDIVAQSEKLRSTRHDYYNDPKYDALETKRENLRDKMMQETEARIRKDTPNIHTLEGLDLKVGGEGMKEYYDKIFANKISNVSKEKVKEATIQTSRKLELKQAENGDWEVLNHSDPSGAPVIFRAKSNQKAQAEAYLNSERKKSDEPVKYIDVPQSLKDTALNKGFSLFAHGGIPLVPVDGDPFLSKKEAEHIDFHPSHIGAEQAPDGHYYIKDGRKGREGKYIRIVQ